MISNSGFYYYYYQCFYFIIIISENFLIFNRNKDGGVPREIGNKLKEFGLWTFLFRKHGCKK